MLLNIRLLLFLLLSFISTVIIIEATHYNLTLPYQHLDPESVVQELQRRLNISISSRREILEKKDQSTSLTGNPIDDCWRKDPKWQTNLQLLADCGIGFGRNALGGKGGQFYVITDSSDKDTQNPAPGTLRHAVIQTEPLWIIFSKQMSIKLQAVLYINSFKTIDGRGFDIHITNGCIILQSVSNIIIHNIHVHNCVPTGETNIRSSPTKNIFYGKSEGDGISIRNGTNIWIDHCSLSYCTDGLLDVTLGSTWVTISNNYFSHHDKVMLFGHSDKYFQDNSMQVTVAFNRFGEALVQRMPRCRHGYFHIVNNDYTEWGFYAIGGSANPTINSQGNRYTAPSSRNLKEVTRRMSKSEKEWKSWNWKSEGDIMVNGAFFVASGSGAAQDYAKASSFNPVPPKYIDQLTKNAGVFLCNPKGCSITYDQPRGRAQPEPRGQPRGQPHDQPHDQPRGQPRLCDQPIQEVLPDPSSSREKTSQPKIVLQLLGVFLFIYVAQFGRIC